MKFTAVLALAAGATASFTKIVRKAEPEPLVVGTLDMYMNSKCLSPEEPRDTIAMLNNECYTFDAGYGSFFFNRDEHLLGGCMGMYSGVKRRMNKTDFLRSCFLGQRRVQRQHPVALRVPEVRRQQARPRPLVRLGELPQRHHHGPLSQTRA